MANCCCLFGAYRSDDDTLYEIQVKPSRAMVNKTCYLGWIAFIICLSLADDDDDDTSIVVTVFNFFSLLSPIFALRSAFLLADRQSRVYCGHVWYGARSFLCDASCGPLPPFPFLFIGKPDPRLSSVALVSGQKWESPADRHRCRRRC
ncbi:hypothetical protein TTRE_0000117201 [Trichuris trichiura]|uniref:Uncharacterized protein n=1 Tax=Trichuris trichiura TaxID=36087 RepID=A0A077Z2I4_TRITR|nr:hypothetical protein TTRE_0000117201 [Trichuris trichiura]